MSTNRRSASRHVLSILAALILLLSSLASVLAQDDATPEASGDAGPAIGDAVVFFDSSGDEWYQVAVSQVVDPDEALESADRGFHWVGVELIVSNTGDKDAEFNAYAVNLVDEEGFVSYSGYANRGNDDYTARPDFTQTTVPAGGSASGWVFYQVINDATPAWIIFNDSFGSLQFQVLANLQGASIEDGADVPFYDASANEIGAASVDEIITDFQSLDSAIEPARGMSAVGVVVTLTNTADLELIPNSYAFYLIDDLGFQYYPQYYFRSEASTVAYPDFTTNPIPAGGSATGLLTFEIASAASVSYITYAPDYQQLYILAQPGEGSTVSGDTLTPVAVPTTEGPVDEETPEDTGGIESGDCVGVADYVAATNEIFAVIEELPFASAESIADVTVDEMRDGADALRDSADAQADLDVPQVAEGVQDSVIEFIEVYADLLDEAADRIDDGDDPAVVEDEMNNDSGFSDTATSLFTEIGNLDIACPDSNVNNILG